MSAIAIGSNLVLVSKRTEFEPNQGRFDVRMYEGTLAGIFGLVAGLSADQGYVIDDTDAPLIRATIRTPSDDESDTTSEVTLTWELLGNDIQKDLFEHPKSLAIPENELRLIKQHIQNPQDGVSPALTDANAIDLYGLLLKGTTHYVVSQYVLRKTQTVSTRFQVQVAFANIEKIHTAAQVVSSEAIPSGLVFTIGNIPEAAAVSDYQWGWLKKTPTVQQFAGNKLQITQEYWLEQWSTYIYQVVS